MIKKNKSIFPVPEKKQYEYFIILLGMFIFFGYTLFIKPRILDLSTANKIQFYLMFGLVGLTFVFANHACAFMYYLKKREGGLSFIPAYSPKTYRILGILILLFEVVFLIFDQFIKLQGRSGF